MSTLYKFYDMQNESDFDIMTWDGVVEQASLLFINDDESYDDLYEETLNPNTTTERIIEILNCSDYDAVEIEDSKITA